MLHRLRNFATTLHDRAAATRSLAAVAANYGKLSSRHREKVWQLKQSRKSSAAVVRALAAGWPDEAPPLPPINVTRQSVDALYKKQLRERDQLYSTSIQKLPTGEAMDVLCRRLLMIADRESQHLADLQNEGKLDDAATKRLARLADAVARIHRLAGIRAGEPEPGEPNAVSPTPQTPEPQAPSFAESLLGEDDEAPPIADVPIKGQTTVEEQIAATVPSSPPQWRERGRYADDENATAPRMG